MPKKNLKKKDLAKKMEELDDYTAKPSTAGEKKTKLRWHRLFYEVA